MSGPHSNADPDTWLNLYPFPMHAEHFDPRWEQMQKDKANLAWRCYAVVVGGVCMGMTSFSSADGANRSVEIGGTYYHPDVRGGPVNPSCKRLLLTDRLREADRLAEVHRGAARHSFGRAKVLERLTEAAVAEARRRRTGA